MCGLLLCHGRVPSARRDHHTTGALGVAILTHRQSRAGEHLPTPNVQQLLSWVCPLAGLSVAPKIYFRIPLRLNVRVMYVIAGGACRFRLSAWLSEFKI